MKIVMLAIILVGFFACASRTVERNVPQPRLGGTTSPLEFTGTITERLESPRVWCGIIATFQGVRYRVDAGAEGLVPGSECIVYHALVGPPLCEKSEPVLSHNIFRVGKQLRLKCERHSSGDLVGWERSDSARPVR